MSELESRFTYHPPKDEVDVLAYQTIRNEAKRVAYIIDAIVPDSREKSLAITKLEEAVMWANAGVARSDGSE